MFLLGSITHLLKFSNWGVILWIVGNNKDFICTPIATPATSATSYEIKPALLNLVMRDQFSGVGDDAALHLNNFVELCDMQKYKEVEGDVVKLKIFSFLFERRS